MFSARRRRSEAADPAARPRAQQVLLVVVIPRLFSTPAEGPIEAVDVQIDAEAVGINFGLKPKTLIMALHSECQFCSESVPFCQRLLDEDRSSVQFVVAALADDTGMQDYLASAALIPDTIVFLDGDEIPVNGTPTLLLADGAGVVTDSWVGLLSPGLEAEVLTEIGG